MKREDVYKVIDSEREYQIKMSSSEDRPDMVENMSVGDVLTAISVNLNKAQMFWYVDSSENDYRNTMVFLRKIAALCVKTMEDHGAPKREE